MIRRRRHPGFTLLEMLAVIAVMVILISAAAPAFLEMSQGSAMRSAVAQVRSTLSLARQYAISRNEVVYFLIAGPNENYTGTSAEHADKCLRAYAVYSIGKNPNESDTARGDDAYLVEWRYLPNGVVFDMEENGLLDESGDDINLLSYGPPARDFLFPATGSSAALRECFGVKFRGDGRASFGSADPVRAVILAEGGVNWDAGSIDETDPRQYFIADHAAKLAVRIRARAGRMETVSVP